MRPSWPRMGSGEIAFRTRRAGTKWRMARAVFLGAQRPRGMARIGAPKRLVDWGDRPGEESRFAPLRQATPMPDWPQIEGPHRCGRPQGDTGHGRHKANCGTGSSGRTSWGETEVRACGLTPLSRHAVLLLVNAQPSRSSGLGRYLRPQQRRHSKYCEPAKRTRRQCMHRKPRRCNGGALRRSAD